MKGKNFSRETKLAVLRELEAGKPEEEICRQYEVHVSSIRRWKKEYDDNPADAFPGKGKAASLEARNAELEATIGRLYLQVELLKKTTAALEKKLVEQKKR